MEQLIRITNTRVAANLKPGNAHAGWLATIRSGITRAGEPGAISAAGPYLGGVPERYHRPLIRAAALRAIHKEVPHTSRRQPRPSNVQPAPNEEHVGQQLTVGGSFAPLRQADSDSTNQLIAALPMVGMESAVEIFNSLISRCASNKRTVPVNFVALSNALARWGYGTSARSQNVRTKIVLDYYATNFSE